MIDAFEVRPSTIPGAGLGLFTTRPILAETTVAFYTGETIPYDALPGSLWAKSEYLVYVCRSCVIVGEGPEANHARYINHSSDKPNCFLVVSSRWKTARIESLRAIDPGEELFFNYGEDFPLPHP